MRWHCETWRSEGGRQEGDDGPVSRILSRARALGWPFLWDAGRPAPRATYPGVMTGRAGPLPVGPRVRPSGSAPLFGLAPGGVCRARAVTRPAGELLPRRFTLTPAAPRDGRGGLFSVALSLPGCPGGGRYPPPRPAESGLSSRPSSPHAETRDHATERPSGPSSSQVSLSLMLGYAKGPDLSSSISHPGSSFATRIPDLMLSIYPK